MLFHYSSWRMVLILFYWVWLIGSCKWARLKERSGWDLSACSTCPWAWPKWFLWGIVAAPAVWFRGNVVWITIFKYKYIVSPNLSLIIQRNYSCSAYNIGQMKMSKWRKDLKNVGKERLKGGRWKRKTKEQKEIEDRGYSWSQTWELWKGEKKSRE